MRTIAHLYDNYDTATQVTRDLEAAGFNHEDVSIVANQGPTGDGMVTDRSDTAQAAGATGTGATGAGATGAGAGASIGTILGGGAGLLAGIGAMAIPGVGPVVAAGWLVATLTGAGLGAGAGGLLGSLTGAGVEESHAHVYTEGVRRGGTLVTVRADDARATQAETIMLGFHPVDVAAREASYRANDGWERFDEQGGSLTEEELAAERRRAMSIPGTTTLL